ncbi:MAG: aminoacyl-tRNA hydrolase [Desulfobulbaceae bacterium]|nr:aminoacyl-tRNA hydrolase [Desulfobulbaceae bacterium]
MVAITGNVLIPESALSFSFSRSSGPGGQNVNKVSTRVTLRFRVGRATCLSERQKELIKQKLAHRISKEGVLQVSADSRRTQGGNREEAVQRFVHLLREAFHEKRPRRKSRVPKRAKERRLAAKKVRSRIKRNRSRKIDREE